MAAHLGTLFYPFSNAFVIPYESRWNGLEKNYIEFKFEEVTNHKLELYINLGKCGIPIAPLVTSNG